MAGSDQKPDLMTSSDIRTDDSDVILMVEGRPIHAHKLILSLASPVFKAMFLRDFKELQLNKIDLPDKKYDDVVEFLKWIYPNCRRVFTDETVCRLLPLVDEYQIECLKDEFEEYLLGFVKEKNGCSEPEFLLKHLYIAERFSLHKVSELAIELSGSIPTRNTEQAPSYKEFNDHLRYILLLRRSLTLEQNQLELSREFRKLSDLVWKIESIQTDLSVDCPLCSRGSLFISKNARHNPGGENYNLYCQPCIDTHMQAVDNIRGILKPVKENMVWTDE